MDDKVFGIQNKIIIILFIFILILYIVSSYYKTFYAQNLFDKRVDNRKFAIELSNQFVNKAGTIISRSNFDPILPNTLLRIILRTPEDYIKSYSYDGKLIVNIEKNNVIDVRDIVKYLVVNKENNSYSVYLN